MTLREKLATMEALWEDISQAPQSVKSPDWHGDVLRDRARQIAKGKSEFTDWEKAKTEIRKKSR